MRVVFFGTSSFAKDILYHIVERGVLVDCAVTKEDGRRGEKSPVKIAALDLGLKLYQPKKLRENNFLKVLKGYRQDIFLVVAYGKILPKEILDIPKACINIHASLLPKYRGAAPIRRAIMAGEKRTGISIINMTEELDAGDIIAKREVLIEGDDFQSLERKLLEVSKGLVLEVFDLYERGVDIEREGQDGSLATYAKKIEKEDCIINWDDSFEKIDNMVKALSPYPGARTYVMVDGRRKMLKILESEKASEEGDSGAILRFDRGGFLVGCGVKSIFLKKVQLEGKKVLGFQDFVLGVRDIKILKGLK